MKVVYIYNANSANEVNLIDRVKTELLAHVAEVLIVEMNDAKSYNISQTPAIIMIRDDLMGVRLLDDLAGQLRVTANLITGLSTEQAMLQS